LIERASRDVPARLSEAADKSSLYGIALQVECHDGDGAGCISCRPDTGRAAHKNYVDLSSNEVGGECWKGLQLRTGEPNVERYRLAIDVAEVAQALSCDIDGEGSRAGAGIQDSHHRHLSPLLHLSGER
jgi:hypothetical protein